MKSMKRRDFLKMAGMTATWVAAWGSFAKLGMSSAFADGGNNTKVAFINLNGGFDGLAMLQPSSGQVYSTLAGLRPTLALNPASLLPLNADFGLHPSLNIFKSLHDEGKLVNLLNVGYQNMSRSHADSEAAFARGVSDRLTPGASGFINRMGARFGWNSLRAVSIAGPDPIFSGGDYLGTQVRGLEDFYFHGDFNQNSAENGFRRDMIYSISQSTPAEEANPQVGKVVNSLGIAVNNSDIVKDALQQASFPTTYPTTNMGRQFKDLDVLFSSPTIGAQVAYMRTVGFDTHSNQGTIMNHLLGELDGALSVFVNNMKAKGLWDNLIVVIYSEFGRTNQENGSGGTDHGGANSLFLTGGAVNSSATHGLLTPNDLTDGGWLPMKINIVEVYRSILARMDYDPGQVFEAVASPVLPALFT